MTANTQRKITLCSEQNSTNETQKEHQRTTMNGSCRIVYSTPTLTAKVTAKLTDFYQQRRTPANKLTRDEARLAARNGPYKKRHEYGLISYHIS